MTEEQEKACADARSAGYWEGRKAAWEIIQSWRKVAKDRGDVLFAERLAGLLKAIRRSPGRGE